MERIKVKFLHDHAPYMAGEIAAFFEKEANALIDRGIAAPFERTNTASASRLKEISEAPQTKNIPAAPQTRHIPGPAETKSTGPAPRKCGKCGKPGHTKANCPQK